MSNTASSQKDNTYHKTIVCDIDDTISFTTNRDWENAKPNLQLINKLNNLHDEGWVINFYTARGSISFVDRDDAEYYYRPIIEKWLKKNNVKYNLLSFEKPLAAYYIDDKAIRPEEFIDLKIESLSGGLSGAIIERRGNKVYKTHPNSLGSAVWYKEAQNYIKTVKVHSLIGDTLCIDYIHGTDEPTVEQMDYIINKFANVPDESRFSTYIDRVEEHLDLYDPDYKESIIKYLMKFNDLFDSERSFCHGDMSFDNMINSAGVLYLIDPNKPKGLYSSWMLDLSKILHSSRRFDKMHIYEYFVNKYAEYEEALRVLELTHWVRMRKYECQRNGSPVYVDKMITECLKGL